MRNIKRLNTSFLSGANALDFQCKLIIEFLHDVSVKWKWTTE